MFKSTTVKNIANNTFFQLLGKLVSMSVTVLATIIITRQYGREGFGEFNIMQNFPALFFIIADFGLNAITSRELSKRDSNIGLVIFNILIFRVFLSVVIIFICSLVLLTMPYSGELLFGIYLSLLLILSQSLFTTLNIVFQVKQRYSLSVLGYVLGSVFVLVCVLVMSYLKVSIVWVNFSYVIGMFITFLLNMYFLSYLGIKLIPKFDFSIISPIINKSLPLGFMFIFSQINFKADTLLISILPVPNSLNMSQTEAVALYGLPYKIFEVALVIPTFFMNSAYPVWINHLEESREKFLSTFVRSTALLFLLGIVCAASGILFAPLAIYILGGPEFVLSINVLRLLLIGLGLFYVTQPLSWFIVTLDQQKYLPWIYLLSAVINVSFNIWLIPTYSFYASSVLTWVCEFIVLIMLIFVAKRSWNLRYA